MGHDTRRKPHRTIWHFAAAALVLVSTAALAVGGYGIDRHVIATGGGTSSGGAFAITGSIGQDDADPLQPATGGSYALTGGFWGDGSRDRIFANGFEP